MAKVTFNHLVDKVQGKTCNDERSPIFCFNRVTGARYVYHRDKAYVNDPTPEQLAHQQKFASASAQVKTIMADNSQLATYREAFEKQTKYKTLRGYIFADVMAQ